MGGQPTLLGTAHVATTSPATHAQSWPQRAIPCAVRRLCCAMWYDAGLAFSTGEGGAVCLLCRRAWRLGKYPTQIAAHPDLSARLALAVATHLLGDPVADDGKRPESAPDAHCMDNISVAATRAGNPRAGQPQCEATLEHRLTPSVPSAVPPNMPEATRWGRARVSSPSVPIPSQCTPKLGGHCLPTQHTTQWQTPSVPRAPTPRPSPRRPTPARLHDYGGGRQGECRSCVTSGIMMAEREPTSPSDADECSPCVRKLTSGEPAELCRCPQSCPDCPTIVPKLPLSRSGVALGDLDSAEPCLGSPLAL